MIDEERRANSQPVYRALVLGCDTGLAHFGWFVARLLPRGFEPLAMGVIATEKSDRKGGVLSPNDNMRRAREVDKRLEEVVARAEKAFNGDVVLACYKSMSLPRDASAVAKIGMAFGVLAAFANDSHLPAPRGDARGHQERRRRGGKTVTNRAVLRRRPPQARDSERRTWPPLPVQAHLFGPPAVSLGKGVGEFPVI